MALAIVGVFLVAPSVTQYVQERETIDSLATPAPAPSATSTTTSSSPTATASTTSSSTKAKSSKTTSQPAAVVTPFVPKHIWISAVGVNAPVVAKSTIVAWDAHLGKSVSQFGVPTGPQAMYQVAWWSDGPRAGEHKNGLIPVLLGHTQIGGYGVFNQLGDLKSGQILMLAAADPHKVLRYKVIKVVPYIPKDDANALRKAYDGRPAAADLAAITCSGSVDASIQSHKDNTMVFFALIGGEGK